MQISCDFQPPWLFLFLVLWLKQWREILICENKSNNPLCFMHEWPWNPDVVKILWNMIIPESPANKNLKKSKPGRIFRTTASGEDLIFFIRGNETLHFSPNYNIELIYGGIGEKSLISCERSWTLQPNENCHGQLPRMRMCPGVWRTLDCSSKLDLLSNNESWSPLAQSRVDSSPCMSAGLVKEVNCFTNDVPVGCVHFIIQLHQFDGAENRWHSVYEAA